MDDMVSRQAAIDAIENAFDRETILNRFVRKIAISAVRLLPSAQPDYTAIKSEIITNIEEFNDAKHHAQWVQDNGKIIEFGLELALRIIEEKERRTDG